MNDRQYGIFILFYIPYLYLVTRLSAFLLFRVIKLQTFYRNSLVPVYLLNLCLCFSILALLIIYGDSIGFPPEIIRWCVLLFSAFFVCNNLLFFLIQRIVKKEAQLQLKLETQRQLEAYTKDLEDINSSMRAFKHDYVNILLTMKGYLDNGELSSLLDYFQEHILPMGYGLTKSQEPLNALHNLQAPEIKGLLSGKCSYALNKELNLQIQIPFPSPMPSIDVIPLARILGIFLDNAIEGASHSPEKELEISWYAAASNTRILIRNSFSPSDPPMDKIKQKNFAGKEGHEGIGLENVESLLRHYPNVHWHMRQEAHMFCQELQIVSESEVKSL